jgi:hypothetical protein
VGVGARVGATVGGGGCVEVGTRVGAGVALFARAAVWVGGEVEVAGAAVGEAGAQAARRRVAVTVRTRS